MLITVCVLFLLEEAQQTRRAALERQEEANAEKKLSYEQRVELAEDVLIICFHTVAPPDR